ncbi:MAG TPA: DUF3857 domain-containing protein [Candidatus Dormibacteraeota bacterium]|nr:DUF3857 domain-containing protein [Candidatus Dormibacteraeota bacterium]
MSGLRWVSSTGLAIGLCLALGVSAPARANQEWLPIHPADLALKNNPASPGSDAMILYRAETLNEQQHLRSEYYRIKIFTQTGKQWGNVEIPYEPNFEGIESVVARTILPSGAVVPFTGKVYDKVIVKAGGVKVYEKSFSLPDVQPGCIVEYMYDEPYDPGEYISAMDWEVQRSLFTREAKFVFIPITDPDLVGHGYYGWRILFAHGPERPTLQGDGSYLLVVHNVPALKTEPYMFPKEMIRERVEFYYANRGNTPTDKYWKQKGRQWNKQLESFIDRKRALEDAVAAVVRAGETPEGKLEKLYARAQQIRNLTFASSMTPEQEKQEKIVANQNAGDVLKHGHGTRKDINELFVGLARAAGMDATLVYVAPRDQAMFMPQDEDADQLASIIVEAKSGSQTFYLDPGALAYPFGLLPWADSNVGGVLLTRNGGEVIHVPGEDSSQSEISRHTKLSLAENGSLSGTLEVDYTGQEAALWRQADRNDDETGRRKDLHDEISGWLPSDATFQITKLENWNDTSKPLRVEGTLKLSSPGNKVYGRLILPLSLYGSAVARAFTSTQRVNVVYFHYPFQVLDDTSIQLPFGFQVESLPKVAGVPSGAIQYQIGASAQIGAVDVTRKLAVNLIAFPVKYYPAVRSIFSLAKAGDASDIVLQATATAAQK